MEQNILRTARITLLLSSILILMLCDQTCKNGSPTGLRSIPPDTYYSKSSDSTSTYEDYYFDLDRDGKTDYMFKHSYWTTNTIPAGGGAAIYVACADSNQIQYSSADRTTRPISDSIMICDSTGWNSHSGALATNGDPLFTYWAGYFVGTEPRNIGLRLDRQGLYYYGWVKLLIADDGKLQIFSYAYKLTPNKPIMAGVHP